MGAFECDQPIDGYGRRRVRIDNEFEGAKMTFGRADQPASNRKLKGLGVHRIGVGTHEYADVEKGLQQSSGFYGRGIAAIDQYDAVARE